MTLTNHWRANADDDARALARIRQQAREIGRSALALVSAERSPDVPLGRMRVTIEEWRR